MFLRGPLSATAHLLRNLRLSSYMDQVLAQLDFFEESIGSRSTRTTSSSRREYWTLHLPALNVELTVLAQVQTDFQGVKVQGPFLNGVCILPNELDEKVAKLHFLTFFSRRAGVRDDSRMSLLMRAQLGWARVHDDSASVRWLRREPFDERSPRMS